MQDTKAHFAHIMFKIIMLLVKHEQDITALRSAQDAFRLGNTPFVWTCNEQNVTPTRTREKTEKVPRCMTAEYERSFPLPCIWLLSAGVSSKMCDVIWQVDFRVHDRLYLAVADLLLLVNTFWRSHCFCLHKLQRIKEAQIQKPLCEVLLMIDIDWSTKNLQAISG